MKKIWFLANVLLITLIALAIHIDVDRLNAFGPTEYYAKAETATQYDLDKAKVTYVWAANAWFPYRVINVSGFMVGSDFLDVVNSGMHQYRFGFTDPKLDDNSVYQAILSSPGFRAVVEGGSYFDQVYIDKFEESLSIKVLKNDQNEYIQELGESIGAKEVVRNEIILGRIVYLVLLGVILSILLNLGSWIFLSIRKDRRLRQGLIAEIKEYLEPVQFETLDQLFQFHGTLFDDEDKKIAEMVWSLRELFPAGFEKKLSTNELKKVFPRLSENNLPSMATELVYRLQRKVERVISEENRLKSDEAEKERLHEEFGYKFAGLQARLYDVEGFAFSEGLLGRAYDRAVKDLDRVITDWSKGRLNRKDLLDAEEQIKFLEESSKLKPKAKV